ncbi:MAG: gene transfer agent family protein [Alphaproteobacteria bacterium]|nr:MAG: gene transfer agent family protein [Alphaproteobacteria bacterium]
MPNPFRGEVGIVLDGRERVMRLTLAALCELEERLDCGSILALVERFETGQIRARDVVSVIAAGLRGGGEAVDEDALAGMEIGGGPVGAVRAAAELLRVTFSVPDDGRRG